MTSGTVIDLQLRYDLGYFKEILMTYDPVAPWDR
jgi:hypothetical protein